MDITLIMSQYLAIKEDTLLGKTSSGKSDEILVK